VYGSSPWLEEALDSVEKQKCNNWNLLIADDGLDQKAKKLTRDWLEDKNNAKIKWNVRSRNLGLFGNLNQAIQEANSEWVILLCSDDKLKENATEHLSELQKTWQFNGLILSSFESINADGSSRLADCKLHHNQLTESTQLVSPHLMVPALLRLGSLNGNLTGMSFSKSLWKEIGPFREDWRHAGDWEWLIRASENKDVLINRDPIAVIRTHSYQLSVRNRIDGHECVEVASVVKLLKNHPLLKNEALKNEWAGHIMQFQLWNILKKIVTGNWHNLNKGLTAINESVGLCRTFYSLIAWLPKRWKRFRSKIS
jgi:glycosyltransferase involved in cell wall biosynthesis